MPCRIPLIAVVFSTLVGLGPSVACGQQQVLTPAHDPATWPTLHRDNQRSGFTADALDGPFEIKWYRILAEEIISCYAEVIVAEGKAFLPTYRGRVHAFDTATGETAWTVQADGPIGNSPCYVDGKVLFGSDDAHDRGTLWCVRARDGRVLWKATTPAGIWNHPVSDGKTVYVGDRGGTFHAIDLSDGRSRWTVSTGAMILTPASISPDGEKIVFGSEDMHVRCVDPSGKLLWTSAKIEGTTMRHYAPTIWADKVVVRTNPSTGFHEALASEDLRAAHEAYTRNEVMTEAERDQYDDIRQRMQQVGQDRYRGSRQQRAEAVKKHQELVDQANSIRTKALQRVGDKVWFDNWGRYSMRPTQHRYEIEMASVEKRLTAQPGQRTFHVLRLSDGRAPYLPLVLYQSGKSGPGTPPTFHPETGELFVWASGTLGNYLGGVPGNTGAILRFQPDARTGQGEFFNHRDPGWDSYTHDSRFGDPADESQTLTLMGDKLLNTHMGTLDWLDTRTRKSRQMVAGRDTYAGLFGPRYVQGHQGGAARAHFQQQLVLMMNSWHGPGCGAVSIADGQIFKADSGAIVCIAGPDKPKSQTHGSIPKDHGFRRQEMPVWPGGNWAFPPEDSYDENVRRIELQPRDLDPIVSAPPKARPKQSVLPPARKARALLEAEVAELVRGAPWRAFHYQMGFTGIETHFARSAVTMQLLSEALPHLSPAVRGKAIAYLDKKFQAGWPIEKPLGNVLANSGRAREYYRLHARDVTNHLHNSQMAERVTFGMEDFAAVWCYAHYADRWDAVTAPKVLNRLVAAFQAAADDRPQYPFQDAKVRGGREHWDQGADRLNAWLSGAIAYCRIMRRAGRNDQAAKALALATELAEDRVHVERADSYYVVGRAHAAKLSRYRNLDPDICAVLSRWARPELAAAGQKLRSQCPWWHHANADIAMGGENWTHSPRLSVGLLLSWAAAGARPEQLLQRVDQPSCQADLYTIRKLSAILRICDR